jgi:phage baseplate assembly protein W
MINYNYPLVYSEEGSIKLTNAVLLPKIRHLLDTIAGERILQPSFGVPLNILYSTGIPQVLAERVRIAVSQVTGVTVEVEAIAYQDGKLSLKLTLATGETVTASYATG